MEKHMMKWYNIEFNIETREMLRRVEAFKEWLYDNDVKFETSAVGYSGVHFELLLEPGSVDVFTSITLIKLSAEFGFTITYIFPLR